ncbi:MAG TPA: Tad domain-containing protein [Bacillota bacterium]|nr:Tad domain-containing protein [Bacillota bacterium]
MIFSSGKTVKQHVGQRGSVYVWIVVLMPLFLLIAGLVTDLSTMYSLVNRVQATLDAAGTSAVSSSLLESSLRDGDHNAVIDTDKARETFLVLVQRNLQLDADLVPLPGSFLTGGLILSELEFQPEGPPSVTVTARVPFRATILKFLQSEISIPVHSVSVLEVK